jgi:hypothetical protein
LVLTFYIYGIFDAWCKEGMYEKMLEIVISNMIEMADWYLGILSMAIGYFFSSKKDSAAIVTLFTCSIF